jgi:hypothetical protein
LTYLVWTMCLTSNRPTLFHGGRRLEKGTQGSGTHPGGRRDNSPAPTLPHDRTIMLVHLSLITPRLISSTEAPTNPARAGCYKRGNKCWFSRPDGPREPGPPHPEKPVTYGLMGASGSIIRAGFVSDNRPLDECSHGLCDQARITPTDLICALVVPISNFDLHHAVYSTVAPPEQQIR